MTDKDKIVRSFQQLRRKGYTARMNFMCCSSCAWYELGGRALAGMRNESLPEPEKVVFYNNQAEEGAFRPQNYWFGKKPTKVRKLQQDLFLQWAGDGNEIVKVLRDNGLVVQWDGIDSHAICIKAESSLAEAI